MSRIVQFSTVNGRKPEVPPSLLSATAPYRYTVVNDKTQEELCAARAQHYYFDLYANGGYILLLLLPLTSQRRCI